MGVVPIFPHISKGIGNAAEVSKKKEGIIEREVQVEKKPRLPEKKKKEEATSKKAYA